MGATSLNHSEIKAFGPFTFDPDCGELSYNGSRVRLPPQPALVLALLTDQPGKLIPREDIYRTVWGEDTHVDFELSLNSCIRQIRSALRDDSNDPKYLETVPKRGYRFLVPVEAKGNDRSPAPELSWRRGTSAGVLTEDLGFNAASLSRWKFLVLGTAALALLAVSAAHGRAIASMLFLFMPTTRS